MSAGTARTGGGRVAVRAVAVALAEADVDSTVVLPVGFPVENLPEGPTYLHYSRWKAVVSELIGFPFPRDCVYVGLSDRLPILRKATTNVLVAQNPHLYGTATPSLSWPTRLRVAFLRKWKRHSVGHADSVVAATRDMQQQIIADRPGCQIRVSVKPIPPQGISDAKTEYRLDIRRLVMIGDVYGYKAFPHAIREVELWARDLPYSPEVVHIGRSIERSASKELEAEVARCRYAKVLLLGPQDHSTTLAQLLAADVFLYPSRRESFGLPLAEALAMGVPSICQDIRVFRELAGDGAQYVSSAPGAIQSALQSIGSAATRRGMAEIGFTRVEPNKGWNVIGAVRSARSANTASQLELPD